MSAGRLVALDQYRGLTVLAMFAVNFLGKFETVPDVLKHKHTFCSLADVVMPQFLLAVGVGMRLSYRRRKNHPQMPQTAADFDPKQKAFFLRICGRLRHLRTPSSPVGGLARRNLGLILLGVILYHLTGKYEHWDQLVARSPGEFLLATLKRGPFETLTHIGVTALWVLPVIGAPGWGRLLFAAASGGLHVWASHAGYYEWNLTPPHGIDGGPLGFLTWTIPLIAGTLLADRLDGHIARLALVGVVVMYFGYSLSVVNKFTPPNEMQGWRLLKYLHDGFPFTGPPSWTKPNYWTMSQRAGSVSYLVFATGFALVLFAVVRTVRIRWNYLDLLGRHALAGYIVHGMVADAVKPFAPADSPGWYVAAAFAVYLGGVSLVLRHLDRQKMVLRV